MVKSLVVAFAGLAIAEFSGGFALLPGEAEAGQTWRVENYGVDSSTCGMSAAPCRSITQAIANSSGGDIISVGPGRYGDLDGDGTLGNIPGEEVGCGGGCLIDVRKRLTIRSTHGAGVTVLDAGRASLPDGVALLTDGVVFGQQGSGFTITGLNTVRPSALASRS
jgi:hypothetical protein